MNVIGHEAVREYLEPLRGRGFLDSRAGSQHELRIDEERGAVRRAEGQKVSVPAAI
jgi:hypothetical protein